MDKKKYKKMKEENKALKARVAELESQLAGKLDVPQKRRGENRIPLKKQVKELGKEAAQKKAARKKVIKKKVIKKKAVK